MAKEYIGNFYQSKSWLNCRSSFISKRITIDGGLCERCKTNEGKIVHHIVHITPNNFNNPNITLNHDNLEYLCDYCHKEEHEQVKPSIRQGLTFNDKGELIQK